MHIIDMKPLEEGVYNDHKADHIVEPPDGWAIIPEDMELPSTFPRLGKLEVAEIDGVMTVVEMTEGTLPEPVESEPTEIELLKAEVTALQLAVKRLLSE